MDDKLEWYAAMAMREALGKDEKFDYQLLVNGVVGENELFRLLMEQNFQDVWWRRNFWLSRQVECDLLLVTHAKLYVLNAKYYNGQFVYRDHVAYFNGKPLQNDPLSSFQLSMGRLKKLLAGAGIEVPVEGRVVFMNPNFGCSFDESVSVECVPRHGVLRMFQDIRDVAVQVGRRNGLNPERIGQQLLALESDSKYNLPVVKDTHLQKMIRGLLCPACGANEARSRDAAVQHRTAAVVRSKLTIKRKKVTCKVCDYQTLKRSAVLLAIEEYCKLFHHKTSFTTMDICWFMGNEIRRKYVSALLTTHYSQHEFGRNTSFENPYYRDPQKYERFH